MMTAVLTILSMAACLSLLAAGNAMKEHEMAGRHGRAVSAVGKAGICALIAIGAAFFAGRWSL